MVSNIEYLSKRDIPLIDNSQTGNNSKLSVLMVETGGWGGLWHYTCCLGNALCEQNVDLNMVTSEGYEEPFQLKFNIFPSIASNSAYLMNLIHIYRIVGELRPSVVHIQSWFSARRDWFPLMISRIWKIPIVLTAHNLLPHDEIERNAPFMFWAFRKIYRSADSIIVHSESNKQNLMETFEIPRGKISVIKHGNYRFFAKKFRIDPLEPGKGYLGEHGNKRIFLLFGTMRHYKGIDMALKAMSRLAFLQKMHLLVAGKPYNSILVKCKKMVKDLKIEDHVTFLPGYFSYEEIARLHTAADICLFPYRDIFQSGSLQTALAFGKPIIATSVGSFPETLNKKNAWMVVPDSPTSLADAMEQALTVTHEELRSMANESLRISTEEHDWKNIALRTGELYLSLV